jgi:hypothetical protein
VSIPERALGVYVQVPWAETGSVRRRSHTSPLDLSSTRLLVAPLLVLPAALGRHGA